MVQNFPSIQEASRAAVSFIIATAAAAIQNKGFFSLVLTGGSTPKLTYEILAEPVNARQMEWHTCHIFWGDERWVGAQDPASNYAMAEKRLLARIEIPESNIHRIKTEYGSPELAALHYEKQLRDFFRAKQPEAGGHPGFDLVLLGMGTDGHTASLFPGAPLLQEKDKWVGAVPAGVGDPPLSRITLTLPLINRARNVLFLIAGDRKKQILNTILSQPEKAAEIYPAAQVRPAGRLVWLVAQKN